MEYPSESRDRGEGGVKTSEVTNNEGRNSRCTKLFVTRIVVMSNLYSIKVVGIVRGEGGDGVQRPLKTRPKTEISKWMRSYRVFTLVYQTSEIHTEQREWYYINSK